MAPKPKILIVDDDKHTVQLLERLFRMDPQIKSYGAVILTARDGVEALEVFAAEHPDVVVCDLFMPRMDGFRFCEELRKRDDGKDCGLVVTSGLYRDSAVQGRIRKEFNGTFYAKPYQIKELARAVEKHLAAGRKKRAASAPPVASPTKEEVKSAPPAPAATAPAPATPSPTLSGDCAETPLSRLLLELHEDQATGYLDLRKGKIEKRISLLIGHPTEVTSNQRQETLGYFLVSRGVLAEDQHQRALERAAAKETRYGEALVELGFITSTELARQLQAQQRYKITNALRWQSGTWAFTPSKELLEQNRSGAMDPGLIVFLGLRNTASLDQAARTCQVLAGRKVVLTPRGQRHRPAFARAFGEDIASHILSEPVFDTLLTRGFDVTVVLPAVEALLITGCVDLDAERAAPGPAAAAVDIPLDELDGLSFEATTDAPAASPPSPAEEDFSTSLYDMLFGDDLPEPAGREPAAPEPLPLHLEAGDGVPEPVETEESGLVELGGEGLALGDMASAEIEAARETILAESLRVQGKDHYTVLGLDRGAGPDEVQAAYEAKTRAFALEGFVDLDLGREYARLEELHVAYRRARDVLTSPAQRKAYDARLDERASAPATSTMSAMGAEVEFRRGEALLAEGKLDEAVAIFEAAVESQPDVADYHAALAWSVYRRDSDVGRTRKHLAQALEIDPDHPAAHDYQGRILADTGRDDDEAVRLLSRALDARPPRIGALESLELVLDRKGDYATLERRYRMLLHGVAQRDPALALSLWIKLGDLYRNKLDDPASARIAYECAARLDPRHPEVLEALDTLNAGAPEHFEERAQTLRARWMANPADHEPLRELFRAAADGHHPDAAFVAAAVLVVRRAADDPAQAFYERYKPRFLVRAQRHLDASLWAKAAHAEDDPDLGDLFALLTPAANALYPLSVEDLEVTAADAVAEDSLPPAFTKVRAYVAGHLGTKEPAVICRHDFADQVHVGGLATPVLLVGPDALAMDDRIELAFRLSRAMSYLLPGRAVGGSRPGRVLKALFTGAVWLAHPHMPMPDPDGRLAQVRDELARLPGEAQDQLRELVGRITAGQRSVNLSRWSRALGRTADRIGLLLCGDPASAARAAAAMGAPPDMVHDLLDFALSAGHFHLRQALGLSVAV